EPRPDDARHHHPDGRGDLRDTHRRRFPGGSPGARGPGQGGVRRHPAGGPDRRHRPGGAGHRLARDAGRRHHGGRRDALAAARDDRGRGRGGGPAEGRDL
ncbi:MAG: hypothetical protein AVDCRST_MAG90-1773, partial [uncultured Microvirga sp.]